VTDGEAPAGIHRETVETLLDEVREQLKAEDAREQSFNTRAGGLAGFVGIIVAITTGVGRVALDSDLSCMAAVLVGIAFGTTMLALLAALGIAIIKVLIPQESAAISIRRIEAYSTWEYVSKEEVMVKGEIMRGAIAALAKDRQRNSSKARWLRHAYLALLVGTAGLVTLGSILAVDAA
jgi:hypothetical protein